MSYGADFVALLAVACIAIGVLIGMAISVCYRRIVCSVHSSNTSHPEQRFIARLPEDLMRESQNVWPQIYGVSDNSGGQSVHQFAASANVNAIQDVSELEESNKNERRRVLRGRANSEPAHSPMTRHNPINHLSKKTRHFSVSADSPHDRARRKGSNQSAFRQQNYGLEELHTPIRQAQGINNGGFENSCANDPNIKEPGHKSIPLWGKSLIPSQAFPMEDIGERREHENKDATDDINDLTLVKMLAHCPDDVRKLFQPRDTSETIFLREKKLVYVCKMLDETGGLLELENMGISLYVPPEAIPYKQRSPVSLVLNWDLNDNPYMDKREALVGPVVYCGPHGTTFEKPCVLKFKHCAFDTRYARILTSQTDLLDSKHWQDLNPVADGCDEDEDDDLPCLQSGVSLSVNECEVEVPHFSLFTCIMRSKTRLLRKWIQVAVFTHDIVPGCRHQEIRIYFLNKTPCALQWAVQNEAKYNFSLACPDTTFLFLESGENMMIHLSDVSDGWEFVAKDTDEPVRSVFFEQIWHGACPHAAMCFRRKTNNNFDPEKRKTSNAPEVDFRGSNPTVNRFDGSERSTAASSETSKGTGVMLNDPGEYSEINIALKLNQELSENQLSVPLNVLAHSLKVKIFDTQVKVIDEGFR